MADTVRVRLHAVSRNRLIVKVLPDGERDGLIWRKEWSWDKSVGAAEPTYEVGQVLDAVVIDDWSRARFIELSLRQAHDPWAQILRKWPVGTVVRAEVVNVLDDRLYAQVEPGVDACIWPSEVPALRGRTLGSLFGIGDQVEGVITRVDAQGHRMEMSLRTRLRELSGLIPEKRLVVQRELFRRALEHADAGRKASDVAQVRWRVRPPIPRPEWILILDDDGLQLEGIAVALTHAGYEASVARAREAALETVRMRDTPGLMLIDVYLDDDSGVQAARAVLAQRPELPLAFMSADPLAEEQVVAEFGHRYPFVFKTPHAIVDAVGDLLRGTHERVDPTEGNAAGVGAHIRDLQMEAYARRTLPEALQPLLARLRRGTHTTRAMVLELDLQLREAALLAAEPSLPDEVVSYSLGRLYNSLLRMVVEEGTVVYEENILNLSGDSPDRHGPKFRNFFQLLDFRCCLAIPLLVPDLVPRHVLVVLDEGRTALASREMDEVYSVVPLLAMALDRSLMIEYMRRYERRYSLGQLFGCALHELRNKLDAIPAEALLSALQAAQQSEVPETGAHLRKAEEAAHLVEQAKGELTRLADAYGRTVGSALEPVDVTAVVRKVIRQFKKRAEDANVVFALTPGTDVPPVQAIEAHLEQILTNLILNAIQQIEKQRKDSGEPTLFGRGFVYVRTHHDVASDRVQIAVVDSGPGIQYHRQRQLFRVDLSKRDKGHGLGLFISRNLAEAMGGQLFLADSVLFLGSAFALVFPRYMGG